MKKILFAMSRKTLLSVFLLSTVLLLYRCDDSETIEEQVSAQVAEEEVPLEETPEGLASVIDENNLVIVNTNNVVGPLQNFWSTRPIVNQTRFSGSNFRNNIVAPLRAYVNNYNIVRSLGGRLDDRNTFFRGVDESGNVITDFSTFIRDLRGLFLTGVQPRIVLDNVPWQMSGERIEEQFGNSRPPLDYGVWRQYINAFLQALIDEFGVSAVETWRFRIGTEPNLNPGHWAGTIEEYYIHYDITVDEVLKLLPNAKVGPGNLLTEGIATFTTEIIDHFATGINAVTGEVGSQMDFFSISYYEQLDRNRIKFEGIVPAYRSALDRYPQFANIPFDIQEFGILRDENRRRGVSLNDGGELGASWYATIIDMALENRITEIYDWGQEIENTGGLPSGRRNVTEMLLMMENGTRLQSSSPSAVDNINTYAGVIPVVKEGNIFLLLYNHHARRSNNDLRTLFAQVEGTDVADSQDWTLNEWTIDEDNGTFLNQLYADIRTAGVTENTSGRIFGTRTSDRFDSAWQNVFNTNSARYEQLSELPQTITDSIITLSEDNKINLSVEMKAHSVKLIQLTPSNALSIRTFGR
jgi:xylan 1,4-beta-xylosidase